MMRPVYLDYNASTPIDPMAQHQRPADRFFIHRGTWSRLP